MSELWNQWGPQYAGGNVNFTDTQLNTVLTAVHLYVREIIQCNYYVMSALPMLCMRARCLDMWADMTSYKVIDQSVGIGFTMRKALSYCRTVLCCLAIPEVPRFITRDKGIIHAQNKAAPPEKLRDAIDTLDTIMQYAFDKSWITDESSGFKLFVRDYGRRLLKSCRVWGAAPPKTNPCNHIVVKGLAYNADRPREYVLKCIYMLISHVHTTSVSDNEESSSALQSAAVCKTVFGLSALVEFNDVLRLSFWRQVAQMFD